MLPPTSLETRSVRQKRRRETLDLSNVRDGDVVLFGGLKGSIRWIARLSEAPVGHAGIVRRRHGNLSVIHVTGRCGVNEMPLETAIKRFGSAYWYSPTGAVDRAKVVSHAKARLGGPYSGLIVAHATPHWLIGIPAPSAHTEERLYCANFVAQCYRAGGAPLRPSVQDNLMSACMISESPALQLRGLIHARTDPADHGNAGGVLEAFPTRAPRRAVDEKDVWLVRAIRERLQARIASREPSVSRPPRRQHGAEPLALASHA